jgi:hypothetical protein
MEFLARDEVIFGAEYLLAAAPTETGQLSIEELDEGVL